MRRIFVGFLALGVVAMAWSAWAQPRARNFGIAPDSSRQRALDPYREQVKAYSLRHYGEESWELNPEAIVLHYTAMPSFPWNLIDSPSFAGETPGLAVHYVVDGYKVWQTLPDEIRSRGCYGMNHRALNIEMMALDATDLASRRQTLETSARLTAMLMERYQIPIEKVYSHQEVATMDPAVVPEVYDRVHPEPYHKIDPGEDNMAWILERVRQLMGR